MKRRSILVSLLVICISWVMLLGCASTPPVPSDEEMWSNFVGTWVNTEYGYTLSTVLEKTLRQKRVLKADFVGEDWLKIEDSERAIEFKITPREFWTDENGDTYFLLWWDETYPRQGTGTHILGGPALFRVSGSGTILECNYYYGVNPGARENQIELAYKVLKIDPEVNLTTPQYYCIYYRE